MKKAEGGKRIAFVVLFISALFFLIPIVWVFLSAFKSDQELLRAGGFLMFPKTWTLENFAEVLSPSNKKTPIYLWMVNSFLVASVYSFLSVTIVSMSAYAYAKLKFKGRDIIFLSILFISSFPSIVTIVPLYKIMHVFGWINSPLSLIFPGLANVFNIFLTRQFMIGIPDSLLESCRIDGAGDLTIFTRIIFPLSAQILVIIGLFSFFAVWNDFLWPSIAINDIDKLTLTAGLKLTIGTYGRNFVSMLSAIAVVAVVPMIAVYCFAEKWFVKGISLSSGIKG